MIISFVPPPEVVDSWPWPDKQQFTAPDGKFDRKAYGDAVYRMASQMMAEWREANDAA